MSANRSKLFQMLHPRDIIAASTPVAASITLTQINQVAGLIGTLLGIFYLIWKWNREASK